MSRLDSLPPDLRAVLSLLLRQRKRYAEVAGDARASRSAPSTIARTRRSRCWLRARPAG